MPFITRREQGYDSPGSVIADSVRQSIAAKQAQEYLARQQAENAPITDPDVVRQQVLAAQARASTGASDAATVGHLPFWQRTALGMKKLPGETETTSSVSPTGAPTTSTTESLPGDPGSPQANVFTPYSGSTNVGHPPPRTSSTVVPPAPGTKETPGLAMVRTDSYYLKNPNLPDTPDNRQIVGSETKAQRTTPLRGTAAILDMLNDPEIDDDTRTAIKGVLNKASATAPTDPNKPKGNPSESERLVNRIGDLDTQIAASEDPKEKAGLMQAQSSLKARLGVLTQKKPQKETTAEKIAAIANMGSSPATTANGQPAGSEMPDEQAEKINAAKAAQPTSAAAGGPPAPAAAPSRAGAQPAGASQKIAAKNTGNWTKGKVYTDGNGNKATWDGDGWIPQ